MVRWALAFITLLTADAQAREPAGLHEALDRLAQSGQFSGAVVVLDRSAVRFSRGYGYADPFTRRAFTPETPVDSASLAKPVTAATLLALAKRGLIDLDTPVRRYLPEFPHSSTTVRHLLTHSAGISMNETAEGLAGKSNSALLVDLRDSRTQPAFVSGTGFTYCNLCFVTLAVLIERASGLHFLQAARRMAGLPRDVVTRPARLSNWSGRAIGYRIARSGLPERFDSWEGEAFYGPANLSVTAVQLARWGSNWWRPSLRNIRNWATAPGMISGRAAGLTWGNWYCDKGRLRCHYPGHHQGFHHLLYWDAERQISVAMVSNNTLAPSLQQRLQRAIVAFALGAPDEAWDELRKGLPGTAFASGIYRMPGGERIRVETKVDGSMTIDRGGIAYPAYPVTPTIRYVPGLDAYLTGSKSGGLHWLSLYEDAVARPA